MLSINDLIRVIFSYLSPPIAPVGPSTRKGQSRCFYRTVTKVKARKLVKDLLNIRNSGFRERSSFKNLLDGESEIHFLYLCPNNVILGWHGQGRCLAAGGTALDS